MKVSAHSRDKRHLPGRNTGYVAAISVARVHHSDIGPVGWPEYFMFGDPHTNYYRGEVYYDDLRLEVPTD